MVEHVDMLTTLIEYSDTLCMFLADAESVVPDPSDIAWGIFVASDDIQRFELSQTRFIDRSRYAR